MTPHFNGNNDNGLGLATLILVTWDGAVKLLLSARQESLIIYWECEHIYHNNKGFYKCNSMITFLVIDCSLVLSSSFIETKTK